MNQFTDPIETVDTKTGKTPVALRTSVVYPAGVIATLVGIRGRPGTAQITVNILLTKLANELKRNNITSYDPEAYESAVANCSILLRGTVDGTATRSELAGTAEATSGNDKRGTLGVGCKATGDANIAADIRSASARDSRQGSKVRAKS